MYDVAEDFRETADAVLVADLVHHRQHAQAMAALHILAEKAEAAEVVGFVPQILRYKPEYKTEAVKLMALNLQQLRCKSYAEDAGYRHYIAVLYQQAACGMAKVGFTTEAEMLLQKLEAAGFEVVSPKVLPKQVVFEYNALMMPAEVAEVCVAKPEQVISQDNFADDAVDCTDVAEEPLAEVKEVVTSMPDVHETIEAPVKETPRQEVLTATDVEEAVAFDAEKTETVSAKEMVTAEAEEVNEAEEISVVEPEGVTEFAAPAAAEEILPQLPERENTAPELPETSAETSNIQAADTNEEVNINKILNINVNEIDKHFEQIKQITAETVKKAELQAEKLKNKVQGRKITADSLIKIKEIVQNTSNLSKQKVISLAPKIQKLKSYASKFLKKDKKQ